MKPLLVVFSLLALSFSQCFPLDRPFGNGPGNTPLSQWWCGADRLYGFLGFSYPMEDDCSAYSYDRLATDFAAMKNNYNASFVRIYLPVCRQNSFWINILKAARDKSVAIIPMIFWDWQQNDPIMYEAENALLAAFKDSEVGRIAPFLIHSVAFGDELGEQGDYWISRMKDFKHKLSQYQVPLTISDDWDRDVYKNDNGGLSDFGREVNDISNLTHAHIQPYYHPTPCPDAFHCWPYFYRQMQFLAQNLKRPIFVSQTMWAYNKDGHHRGAHDEADNMPNYLQYWNNVVNGNCDAFKSLKIGWFFHTYYGEPGFDIIGSNGKPVFDFVPKKC